MDKGVIYNQEKTYSGLREISGGIGEGQYWGGAVLGRGSIVIIDAGIMDLIKISQMNVIF